MISPASHRNDFDGDALNTCSLTDAELNRPPVLVSARQRRRELAGAAHAPATMTAVAKALADIPRADGQVEPYLIAPHLEELIAVIELINMRLREKNPPGPVGRAASNTQCLLYPLTDFPLKSIDRRILEQAYRRKGYKVSWKQGPGHAKNQDWSISLIW